MSDNENVDASEEGVVFDPFAPDAKPATKTVVLAAPYTDGETEHEADTEIELDRDEADRLLHAGLARTPEQDAEQRVALAANAGLDAGLDAQKSASMDDVLAEVGDDPEKAAAALAIEKAGKNRKTLVSKLEAIVNTNPEGN